MIELSTIPTINASLNGVATALLLTGWVMIKRGNRQGHMKAMMAALAVSALFLGFYLYYHFNVGAVTRYERTGFWRPIYFTILFTHIPLAIVVVPGCLAAVWHAMRGQFERHTRITRWLWPVWMYVSVTGVLIYLMLYVFH
jgi:putative membrane protein